MRSFSCMSPVMGTAHQSRLRASSFHGAGEGRGIGCTICPIRPIGPSAHCGSQKLECSTAGTLSRRAGGRPRSIVLAAMGRHIFLNHRQHLRSQRVRVLKEFPDLAGARRASGLLEARDQAKAVVGRFSDFYLRWSRVKCRPLRLRVGGGSRWRSLLVTGGEVFRPLQGDKRGDEAESENCGGYGRPDECSPGNDRFRARSRQEQFRLLPAMRAGGLQADLVSGET